MTRTSTGPARDPVATVAAACVAVVLAGAALVVDVGAAAAFDAPKRLVAFVGLVLAAATLLVFGEARVARPSGRARTILVALGFALAGVIVATMLSPRADVARAGLRGLVVLGLALPLGASRVCEGPRRNGLLTVFLGAVALDALVSLFQSAGLELFAGASVAGRADTGAFVGNEGHLAQLVAFAAIVAAILVWRVARADVRILAGSAFVLFAVALVVNRNVTALGTLATGVGVALVSLEGRRAVVPIAAVLALLVAVVAVAPPIRERVVAAVASARAGDWDAVTTWRLGAWSAAAGMIRERPVVGHGPGTFGAEFMAHRLDAEIRQRRRLVVPLLTSSFGEAHSEYLQASAEAGVPATLAVLVAAGTLLAGLAGIARDPDDARRVEAAAIAALIGAAGIASLTWFPWQRPVTAVPLLLAAGRGWRLVRGPRSPAPAGGGTRVVALAVAALLVLLVVPELPRYAAERRLAAVTETLRGIAAGGRVVPEARPRLERLAAIAGATAAADPSDTRGLVAAGTAMLVAGDPADAERWYRTALARGERAEIDLNLARASALAGRQQHAEAALRRAVWVSPALIDTLPAGERPRLERELAALEDRLRRGELEAPPALPEPTAPTGH